MMILRKIARNTDCLACPMPTRAHCAPIWMPNTPHPATKTGIMRVTMPMTSGDDVNHAANTLGNAARSDTSTVAEVICAMNATRMACRTRSMRRAPKLNPMIGWMPCWKPLVSTLTTCMSEVMMVIDVT